MIQGVVPSVKQTTAGVLATSGRAFHEVRVVLHKETFTGETHSAVGVLKDPTMVNRKDTDGTIPVDRNTVRIQKEPLPNFGLVLEPLYLQLA